MSDEELLKEAMEQSEKLWRLTWDQRSTLTNAILAALRRVRDAATAAERQRCAAVCRDYALLTSGHWAPDVLRDVAAAIERQDGE